jgi:hypothetical protein
VFLIAHGISVRTDLPVPEVVFWWGAAIVLAVSFVALAALWPQPRLEDPGWRPLPGGIGRFLASRPVEIVCGAIGVFLLGLTIYAGLEGTESTTANWAPIFVYVIFWLALVPLSLVFGDVFRAFNPWRAIGRAVAWIARKLTRSELPDPLAYPDRLGRWPAAAGLFAFAAMELVVSGGDKPQTVAVAALVYSALTFVGMALYGVERWSDRGEAFSVYFNLFSRLSPFETRDREVGLRKPLSGLAQLDRLPGTVAMVVVMIGTVSFDGLTSKRAWNGRSPDISEFFQNRGLSPEHALELTFLLGMLVVVLLVALFYRLGILGTRSVGGGFSATELGRTFAHSLVPIAMAYVGAHYFTLLLYQGQAIFYLASDPLGHGSDIFGTAGTQVKYGLIGSNIEWYVKVGLIVLGHVAGLILAHDRAVALYRDAKQAVRSQYWMLGVMLGFTLLAIWLVSESNT